jgi:hypothetical protein
MYTLRFSKSNPFVAVYEGDDAAAAAAAAATKAAADKAAADKAIADAAAADRVANQDELNAVLKREKDKFRVEREKLITQLEGIQANSRTTAETKAQLETQLEELRRANLSTEERARLEKAKLEKDWSGKLAEKDAEANQWRNRHNELQTGYSISSAAAAHAVVPTGIPFLESYLKPRSKLVEVQDTTGKGTGKFEAKVSLTVPDKDGKAVEVEYSVGDAVKQMKDMPETFGFLFASSAAAGLGAGTGAPGKAPNVAKMSPEAYMEARKKNPASLGLK